MRHFIFIAVLTTLTAVGHSHAHGREERDPARNAALQYWSALVYIPEDPRMTQWEVARYSPLTASVEDAEFLLERSGLQVVAQWSLEDLRRGAKMPYCEWALPILEKGPNTVLHHTQRHYTATGLLLLSARLERSRGNWNAAVDDLNSAWVFLRHLAHDRTRVSWSAHFGRVENWVAPLVASWLPDLEESTVLRLQQHLERLPAPPPWRDVVRWDKDMWIEWIRESLARHGLPGIKAQLLSQAKQYDAEGLTEAFKSALTSEEELVALLEDTRRVYDECAELASLPMDQFKPTADRFQRRIAAGNPLTRMTLGWFLKTDDSFLSLKSLQNRKAKSDAISAMFRAAVALRLEGRDGFDRVRDPFGDGPFVYAGSEDSYTLTSALTIDGESFSMKFGKGALPAPETESQLLIYNADADAAADIQAALKVARRDNKRLLLQWGFNGCIPCYALHRTFEENERLAELLHTEFIHLPVDVTNQDNRSLYDKYDVQMPGVPHLTVLDAEGEAVANVKPTEQFYVNGSLDPSLLQAFLEKWSAEGTASSEQ